MALPDLARQLARYANNNSPALLTAVAVSGVVSTAFLSAKGAMAARDKIFFENTHRGAHDGYLSRKEEALLTWKCYIPATVTGCVSIACIIASTTIGHRRQVALAGAVAMGERAFGQYRDEVVKVLGDKKEGEVRTAVAQRRVDSNPPSETNVVMTGAGDHLCYEAYSGRYFRSDMETIRKAVNDVNEQILGDGYASCNEFWSAIGLETTKVGDEVGWISERLMDVSYNAVLHSGKPVMVIDYNVVPIRGYNVFG